MSADARMTALTATVELLTSTMTRVQEELHEAVAAAEDWRDATAEAEARLERERSVHLSETSSLRRELDAAVAARDSGAAARFQTAEDADAQEAAAIR
jgi:hypothetical protein